jgi:hypothetical protein
MLLELVFAFNLVHNTLVNATSKSKLEKQVMTPISLITSICLIIIALGLLLFGVKWNSSSRVNKEPYNLSYN